MRTRLTSRCMATRATRSSAKSAPPGLPADHVDALHALVRRTLAGESCQVEMPALRKNGGPLVVEIWTTPCAIAARRTRSPSRGTSPSARPPRAIACAWRHSCGRRRRWRRSAISPAASRTISTTSSPQSLGTSCWRRNARKRPEARSSRAISSHAAASARRAQELIAQLLTFARGRRGERSAISLAALIRDAHAFVRSTLPSTLELRMTLDDVPNVVADTVQLEQVLVNLCINARDAMNGVGIVHVSVRSVFVDDAVCASCRNRITGDFVELAVRDEGPGIAPEVLERIFEPFYSTKAVGKGNRHGPGGRARRRARARWPRGRRHRSRPGRRVSHRIARH